jgi:hypothetical protein
VISTSRDNRPKESDGVRSRSQVGQSLVRFKSPEHVGRVWSMGSSPREERRAALHRFQELLAQAEVAVSTGTEGRIKAALKEVGKAFDAWSRHQQRSYPAPDSEETSAADARRSALLMLARLLGQIDDLVSRGDVDGVKAKLDKTKRALDISRKLDEQMQTSGFRLRFPRKAAK